VSAPLPTRSVESNPPPPGAPGHIAEGPNWASLPGQTGM